VIRLKLKKTQSAARTILLPKTVLCTILQPKSPLVVGLEIINHACLRKEKVWC